VDASNWSPEVRPAVEVLRGRLADCGTCFEMADAYEDVLRAIWAFCARLVGEAGTRAILARAVRVAARDEPLAGSIQVTSDRVELDRLRASFVEPDCDVAVAARVLLRVGAAVFQTLIDLTGNTLVESLARELQRR